MSKKTHFPKKTPKKRVPPPIATDTASGLTKKELHFCQEYILDYNCARAARDTGISHESRKAYSLLKDQKVIDEIERLEQAVGKKLEVKAQDIAAGLLFIAKKCIQKGRGKWNPRAAVQAFSRLGNYTGGFKQEIDHKLKHSGGIEGGGGPDFSKMTEEELDAFIDRERRHSNPA